MARLNFKEARKLLDAKDIDNVPKALAGTTNTGTRPSVSLSDSTERKMVLSQLIQDGAEDPITQETMKQRFGMSRDAVKRLSKIILNDWDDSEQEFAKYSRVRQQKRLHRHIARASKLGQMNAVMTGETTLMKISGTEQLPEGARQGTDVKITEAIAAILGSYDMARLKVIVQLERAREEKQLPPATTIETQGQELDE